MTLSNLITALIAVESSGNDLAIGDGGKAIGALQIHRAVVLDVNRITGSTYRHQDMTNRVAARAVRRANGESSYIPTEIRCDGHRLNDSQVDDVDRVRLAIETQTLRA